MGALDNISQQDIEKVSAMVVGVATLGFKIYTIIQTSKGKPEPTIEEFTNKIKECQDIPTPWDQVYGEE